MSARLLINYAMSINLKSKMRKNIFPAIISFCPIPPLFLRRVGGIGFCLLPLISIILIIGLTACGKPPQVMAEARLFLPLSLEFLGEYQLPKMNFQDTPVGGLSGLTYDREKNRFYAISDDRSQLAPARFYTLNLIFNTTDKDKVSWQNIEVESVTFLKNEQGQTYTPGTIDTEGIAVSPRGTVYISSEGVIKEKIAPFIEEFNLKTGQLQASLQIPQRYLPQTSNQPEESPRGIQDNLGFESLTLGPNSLMKSDPFRLFTAIESSLLQDNPPQSSAEKDQIRMMHYLINPIGSPILVAEHLYILDSPSEGVISSGLSELTTLEKEGYFLSLERTFGLSGFGAKIFQVVNANATDTSTIVSLENNSSSLEPLRKKLLLDLSELNIDLDNLEGMTLGPHLPDGSQTLVLVSDNNFRDEQITQFLLFRLLITKS